MIEAEVSGLQPQSKKGRKYEQSLEAERSKK